MHIKNLILTSTLALSFIGTSMVFATQETHPVTPSVEKHQHYHQGYNKVLSAQQQQELHTILQGLHEQMRPLLKEKQALNLQLRGKIATPNAQWKDIASLVDALNENNAKITTLFTKTQFTTFQKLGVLLPLPQGKHVHGHHQSHSNDGKHKYA